MPNFHFSGEFNVACISGRKCLYSLVNYFLKKFRVHFSEASNKPIPKMNRN